ncbi:tetratricopeptide repeat protein [Sporosalibacterium faouarense]|uniref:tetratricopeptide repeat protein n=1 Tax=Sporosalibacterium faouarense TaxID=516123 RepID=UPI00192CB0E0|nr:D-alanyl-lipoteichoic acid biosynthesis protein DltD [Sporosalibacterium faouarense]
MKKKSNIQGKLNGLKDRIKLLIEQGLLEQAMGIIIQYEKVVPRDVEIHSMKAVIYMMSNKLVEAERTLKEGLMIDKYNFDILYNLGYVYSLSGRYYEAMTSYYLAKLETKDLLSIEDIQQEIMKISCKINNGCEAQNKRIEKFRLSFKTKVILVGNKDQVNEVREEFDHDFVIVRCIDFLNSEIKATDINFRKELKNLDFDYIVLLSKEDEEIQRHKEILNRVGILEKKIFEYHKFNFNFVIEGFDYKLLQSLKNDKVELITTGLSYAEVGVDGKFLERNSINIALSSQDLFYDFEFFKFVYNFKYIKENLKYAIINLGYYSFDYDLSRTFERTRIHRYYPLLKTTHNYDNELGIRLINKMYHREVSSKAYLSSRIFKSNKVLDSSCSEKGKKYAMYHSRMNRPKIVNENKKIFDEFINFLINNNVKPIILVCPVSQYYYKYSSSDLKGRFYKIINEFKRRYDFQIIDLFKSSMFNDEDFWDDSHLNNEGAKKLTIFLEENIEW